MAQEEHATIFPSPRDDLKRSKDTSDDVGGKLKRNGASLRAYASAQDLRYLDVEKEKQDDSSPRGVLEACFVGSASGFDKCSSEVAPEEAEIKCSSSRAMSNWRKFFKLWKKRSMKRLASFPPLGVALSKRKTSNTREDSMLRDIYNFQSSLQNFSFSELEAATGNFGRENIIGRGGYAEVYRGCLPGGKLIAVKRLNKGTSDERIAGFLSELGVIAHVNHSNIAKLIGCGIEGGMFLVFQLSPLGSLGSLLHGQLKDKLDWSKRYKIALGTADGLTYLHETCERRIIHRDIKSDNILLTDDFEPQICDFGLAKWLPKQWTHHNVSKFEGTFGYFAPEYFMHGVVDEKTDVYAFGVLLLELVSGRRALDDSQQSVVLWAKPLIEDNNIKEVIDPSLGDDYNPEEMDHTIFTAALCIDPSPVLRPRMSQVVVMLRGDEYATEYVQKRHGWRLQRTYSEEVLDVLEYNSTKHLNDMNRIKEIALGS